MEIELKQIVLVKIENLKPAEYNPRIMSDDDMEKLKSSIRDFDMVEPLVINKDFTVIGGHQRLKAMKALGYRSVPCVFVDLDKKKEKLLNLALNRIVGDWEQDKLSKLINEISGYDDIKLSGLDESEIEALVLQHDLVFEDIGENDNEEHIKDLFKLNERVPIDLKEPVAVKNKNKVAFFTENFDEWSKIKDHFQSKNKSELDTKKLLELIK